jgi:hypothetical protein
MWFSAGRLIAFHAILSAVAVVGFPLKSTLCSPLGGKRNDGAGKPNGYRRVEPGRSSSDLGFAPA